ncbi:LuxR family transcriptional regulator [Streptomyces sp. NPDC048349]|uniref:LuxR family transcriptional regulator n=1 Tax=Streptomyces sp. NPDC048349 TaxID=3155486 RepID=UPI00341497FA
MSQTQSALDADVLAVYRAVLLHREQSPDRLAERLSIPEQRVRESLERLVELALLRPSWDDPADVRAVSPDLGLEMMLQREQQELALRQERVAQTRAALTLLATEYVTAGRADAASGTEVLHGKDEIRTRLETLASRCEREVLSLQPEGSLTPEAIEAGRPLNEQAILRGVRFRSIYLHAIGKDRQALTYLRWADEHGGEIRLSPTLPMRLLIVDGEEAVLPGDAQAGQPTALLVRSAPVVRALHALFTAYWKSAETLQAVAEATGPAPGSPSPQERELLRMLAEGVTDAVVARALGVSVRTQRRMVADLSALAGASSRFELGVKAARLGWL